MAAHAVAPPNDPLSVTAPENVKVAVPGTSDPPAAVVVRVLENVQFPSVVMALVPVTTAPGKVSHLTLHAAQVMFVGVNTLFAAEPYNLADASMVNVVTVRSVEMVRVNAEA